MFLSFPYLFTKTSDYEPHFEVSLHEFFLKRWNPSHINNSIVFFPKQHPMIFMPGYLLDHVRCAGASKLVFVHRMLHLSWHGMPAKMGLRHVFSEPTHKTNLQGTNISHPKAVGKMIVLSHWWDMFVPGRVLMMYPICSNINQKKDF